ncbi:GNAT family N-acetyltransferase [Metabacillus sp. GX 13764]|uniref:GNAT family N-acetyltransferase n=1 Tax=Metabacillus kandeliae TaxID=2900151 RepID=UPI001E5133C6|nr:GNAT family N-acetyltransferase [Metabacillus kandeliae]MCD7034421.1 GNAT family N-acetyltransferase [Metabacillus kandeliae]
MKVIKLNENWYEEALKLSEYAFQYKVPEEEKEKLFDMMKEHHELYGILDGDELAANMHFLPLEVFLGGKKMRMGGLAGVATYPEYRRQGHVREMLEFTLQKLKEEGYPLSMLHPFKVSFYRKYGWELFSDRLVSTLTSEDLTVHKKVEGTVKRVAKEAHNSEIDLLYDAFAEPFAGMLVRDRAWWENSVYRDYTLGVYYNKEKQPKGYILYKVKDKKMTAAEFVPLNEEARHGLWNFICQHDSMIKELVMITHKDEPIFHLLPDPRIKAEIKPYFMARIVDAEAFLKEYPFKEGKVTLHITDEYASWNNGSFSVSEEKAEKTGESSEGISLSINDLAAILFGYQSVEALSLIGKVKGEKTELEKFSSMLPGLTPFFYDFF